jgi:hypothetical protein
MTISNCPRCGKIYEPVKNVPVCHECVEQENRDLKTLSEYLRKFPMASAIEVTERTNVPVAQIMRFVRAGALRLTEPPEQFKCRMCGDPVKKGTLCGDCREKVEELNRDAKKKKKK